MASFTEIAQNPDRGEALALNHTMFIDGRDRTFDLQNSTITYTTDVGGSGLELNVLGDLEQYEDKSITLNIGYGDFLVPYFQGKLVSCQDNNEQGIASGLGFGPFRLMAESDIGKDSVFYGRTLTDVAYDLSNRCELTPRNMEVRGGRSYIIPVGEQYPWETKCLEVLNSIMEGAEFVAADMPGGRRIVMPRPRPGSNTGFLGVYNPNHYMTLDIDPLHTTTYHSVIVYRNGDNNIPVVYDERKVDPTAPRTRRYVVSDFPGTQAQAEQRAFDLAQNLRAGERQFTMTTFFNPDLLLWKGLKLIRRKKVNDVWHNFYYDAVIDNTISVNYSPGDARMEVSGTCYELRGMREEVPTPPVGTALSQGVLRV